MTRLKDFFHTDFGAMTAYDYVGMTMTVIIFILMVVAYIYAFHPKNRERLNSYGAIPLENDHLEREERR